MRVKTELIHAQVQLVKAKTAKIRAETVEREGSSILADEEDEELEELENRNTRVNAQLEQEQAKLARMMGAPPPNWQAVRQATAMRSLMPLPIIRCDSLGYLGRLVETFIFAVHKG
jgi:hypothetical protein